MKKNYLPLLLLGGAALAFFAFKKKPKGKVIVPEPEKLTEGEFLQLTEGQKPIAVETTAQVDYIAPQQKLIEKGIEEGMPVSEAAKEVVVSPIQEAIQEISQPTAQVDYAAPTKGKKAPKQKILKREVTPTPIAKPVVKSAPIVTQVVRKPLPVAKPVVKAAPKVQPKAILKPTPVAKKPTPVKVQPKAIVKPKALPKAIAPKPIVKAVAPKPVAKALPKAVAPKVKVEPKAILKKVETPKATPKAVAPVQFVAPSVTKNVTAKAAPVVQQAKKLPIASKGKKVGNFPMYG